MGEGLPDILDSSYNLMTLKIHFSLILLFSFSIEKTQDADTYTGIRTHTHTYACTHTHTHAYTLTRIENVRTQHGGLKSQQIITED